MKNRIKDEWERKWEIERYQKRTITKAGIILEVAGILVLLILNTVLMNETSYYLLTAGLGIGVLDEFSEGWLHTQVGARICALCRIGAIAFFAGAIWLANPGNYRLIAIIAVLLAGAGIYRLYQLYRLIRLGFFDGETKAR